MNPFRTLQSWLGRPAPPRKKTPARRPGSALGCEPLEARLAPALTPFSSLAYTRPDTAEQLPVTGTHLVAQVRSFSANPLQDLANVVDYFGLETSVDVAGSSVVLASPGSAVLAVRLADPAAAGTVAQALARAGIFDWITPEYVYTPSVRSGPDLRERVPDDPRFPEQYHHPIIQTPTAWDRTFGTPTVVTAVLDDGVDVTHPDLKDNVWTNPREVAGDGLDNDGNGFTDDVNGWDFVANRNVVTPDTATDTHGTQVAGLLAGRIENALGIAGVAGRSSYMPLKVIGNGPTTSLTLARAVGYAVQNGARIINNSLNIDPFLNDTVFQAAVRFAHDRGLLWVNSAGNLSIANPARQALDEMLIVAATDRNDVKTGYSNYGSGIDITAPGGDPGDGLLTTILGGGYAPAFGTSMAAALVSGTAALVWSAFPGFTRDQVASALMGNADDLAAKNPAFLDLLGAGRVNAGKSSAGAPPVTRLGRLLGLPEVGQPAPATLAGFTLRLLSNLDPGTVTPANFELRWAGPDNQFGSADDALIPFIINAGRPYRYGTNHLEFAVGAELARGLYRFTARSGGLADPFGKPVDGDGDGRPGGDLVREFGVNFQVQGRVFEDIRDDGYDDETDPGVSGRTVFADLNRNGVFDRASFTSRQAGAIPDADPGGITAVVEVSGLTGPACDVTVSVFLSHPVLSDLTITLVGPNGERVLLFRNRQLPGRPTQTPTVLAFEDGGEESSTDTPTLVTHRLRPEEPLARLRGINPNGTWRVVVADTTPGDVGTLMAATIGIGTEPCAVTDANGAFGLTGLPAGASPLLVVTGAGWVRSAGGGSVPADPSVPEQVSLGLVRTGAAYGRVLLDDGDRQFGRGDAGLAGTTVFIDRGDDGEPDAGDPTAVTDAAGNFVFPNLTTGRYTLRLADRPGFPLISPDARTAVLTAEDPTSSGNDFLVGRAIGPVQVIVPLVGPDVRGAPLDAVPIALSEPIPDFRLSHLTLTRNDIPVPLTGATLIGSGVEYTLIGLAPLTAADGTYRLTAAPPAPPGEPTRRPQPVDRVWTVDATPPAATLTPIRTVGVTAVAVRFSEPVVGLTPGSFVLRRDGVVVPLTDAQVAGSGAEYQLVNLGPLTREPGDYTLELLPGGARDAAGNPVPGEAATAWRVTDPLPPVRPREGQRTVVGPGPGGPPLVNVYDPATGKQLFSVVAYDVSFTGGVRVAAGDVNGDGIDDIITAPGPGGGPHVRVFDGRDGSDLGGLMAFEPTFTGGVYVAAGDLDGDGVAELIVTPDQGGGPRVRVFAGRTLAAGADFFGIDDPAFRGGARAAVGDLNGDGRNDLLVSAGFGGGPRVAGYDGKSVAPGAAPARLFNDFFVFEEGLRNGAYLAAGDVDGDGFADLVAGGGPTGGPRVLVLSGKPLAGAALFSPLASFFAGDPAGRGGVRVAVKDQDGDGRADVFAADGDGQRSTVRVYPGSGLIDNADPPFTEFDAFGTFVGGVFIG